MRTPRPRDGSRSQRAERLLGPIVPSLQHHPHKPMTAVLIIALAIVVIVSAINIVKDDVAYIINWLLPISEDPNG